MLNKNLEMRAFILGMVFLAILSVVLSVVLKWQKDKQIIESFTSNNIVDPENIFKGVHLSGFDAQGKLIDYAKNFGMYGADSDIIDSGSDISGHNHSVDIIFTRINSSIKRAIQQIKAAIAEYKEQRTILIKKIQNAIDSSHSISMENITEEKKSLEDLREKIFNSLKTVNKTRSALNQLGGMIVDDGNTFIFGNEDSLLSNIAHEDSLLSKISGSPSFRTIVDYKRTKLNTPNSVYLSGKLDNYGKVELSWDKPYSKYPIQKYMVEYKKPTDQDWKELHSVNGENTLKYKPQGLDLDQEYKFRVFAQNDQGISYYGNEINITTTTLPDKPNNLVVDDLRHTASKEVTLKWEKPSYDGGSDIIEYVVYYNKKSDKGWKELRRVNMIQLYRITDLTHDETYKFTVFARNSNGYSDYSNIENIFPQKLLKPPINVVKKDWNAVSWKRSGKNITKYKVRYRKPSDQKWTEHVINDNNIFEYKIPIVQDDENPIGYDFEVSAGNSNDLWSDFEAADSSVFDKFWAQRRKAIAELERAAQRAYDQTQNAISKISGGCAIS